MNFLANPVQGTVYCLADKLSCHKKQTQNTEA